jgi:hypothetical protein
MLMVPLAVLGGSIGHSPGELVTTRGSDGMAVDFGSGEGIARFCSHWTAARTSPSFLFCFFF